MKTSLRHLKWCALLVGLVSLIFSGCATTEADNEAARPWNSPNNAWETGLPASLLNGR